jgi:recombination protein RecR
VLPEPIKNLVLALERLPGIGPKTASRLAFFLLRAPAEVSGQLAEALADFKDKIAFCEECFNITSADRNRCDICESGQRDGGIICVVEEPLDVLALERVGAFQGKYHVLQGVLSPIEGIGPDDLKIKPLLERIQRGGVQEVILATNPSMEGEATAILTPASAVPGGACDAAGARPAGWRRPGICRSKYAAEGSFRTAGDVLTLKNLNWGCKFLDNSVRMRIIGKHIDPHADLVQMDRSLTTEQRLTSETQCSRFRSLTSRCRIKNIGDFVSL